MSELTDLFQATLRQWVADDAQVGTIVTLPDVARDYSGAIVRFYRVTYGTQAGAATIDLVTKDALIYERQTLALLHTQAHPHIPFSYSLDMHTPQPCLLCEQYVGTRLPLSHRHIATVAQTLAAIHAVNVGAPYLPWMRRLTSQTFFSWWWQTWERACANADFIREFREYLVPVERAATRFAQVLDQLWQENTCSTVLHTDLSAWHVLLHNDQPYLIDWDQTRYGPLYLDLVNLFTPQTVSLYYDAIVQTSLSLPYEDFIARYHAAWAFVGLKYMIPPLLGWVDGKREENSVHLHQYLQRAIATHAPSA